MALILVLITTFVIYFINRKKHSEKTVSLKIWQLVIYFFFAAIGLFLFFEIIHIIKYGSID